MCQPETVLATIRAELARRHKTQHDLAEVLGVSQGGVSRRLRGDTPLTLPELCTIADWLGVSASYLVADPFVRGGRQTDRRRAVIPPQERRDYTRT